MKLRGHHIFCTALFSGHGYDEAFTKRMSEIIEAWEAGEAAEVLTSADDVCLACPNAKPCGGCTLGTEDALRRDTAALQVLGLNTGEILTWQLAGRLLSRLSEDDFQAVCGNCRWQRDGLCTFKLLQKSISERI